ncbi:type III-A CRISPR-associated CARF protein Csm6 [Veillonella caviae]|uniref:type III-A CRISPR-associated CARF protein Csm6 n=1 Tax=Veillonella caviae TaxID=248316 RepID=UPI002A911254|nr:CRISPR-associated protein Csm6 [Veillonella caviae]MDY5787669.1 CRISPR-associated protein Csm6 [Veillonella caviae]
MRILYSPVGDTDPIRGMRDGAMLHIVRHYHPDKVVLFLSRDMVEKEHNTAVYTKAITSIQPDIDLEIFESDLVDVHKIDALMPLVDEFYRLRESHPNDEFLLNLSSGTPQMKEIMSYLTVEYNLIGIQVDSPQGASNRSEFALQGNEDIDFVIESNLDNEPGEPNRCHEPKLAYLKRNQLKQQLIQALHNYQYDVAQQLFNAYAHTIPGTIAGNHDILSVLKHASSRLTFDYDKAMEECSQFDSVSLGSCYKDKQIRSLDEFLMIMEVRLKQKQLEDFILKITPFMHTLMRYYMTRLFGVRWRDVEVKIAKDYYKVDMNTFASLYPTLYDSWNRYNGTTYNRDRIDLSLYHMLDMMRDQPEVSSDILKVIESIRRVEQTIRNNLAHKMIIFSENQICELADIQSLHHFYQDIRGLFQTIIDGTEGSIRNKLVYDAINSVVIERLQ